MAAVTFSNDRNDEDVIWMSAKLASKGNRKSWLKGALPRSAVPRKSIHETGVQPAVDRGRTKSAALNVRTPGQDPPTYESLVHDLTKSPSQFSSSISSEDGTEALPSYTCSLHAESLFDRKQEMKNPFERADIRTWDKVFVILRGPALQVYKLKRPSIFTDDSNMNHFAQLPAGMAGTLTKSYSLQHAEVGIAEDYVKRPYVIRIRAETDQFLLSCDDTNTFIHWLESLNVAIGLALPLEERSLPPNETIPRRRRYDERARRGQRTILRHALADLVQSVTLELDDQSSPPTFTPVASITSLAAAFGLQLPLVTRVTTELEVIAREAEYILQDRLRSDGFASTSGTDRKVIDPTPRMMSATARIWPYTALSSSVGPPSRNNSTYNMIQNTIYASRNAARHGSVDIGEVQRARETRSSSRRGQRQMSVPAVPREEDEEEEDDSTTASENSSMSDGKWCPVHQWTPAQQARYVRRCMVTLCSESPRRSDFVIMEGMRFKISWDTKMLVPCGPDDVIGSTD
ncbi:MAG: hypothetical protein M1825_006364 [Sarcosagium campestre]|nr:MAG: hypothetical protein M1825_006364 [Sarcosagium campestre]